MDLLKVHKALANETRFQILQWLRTPEEHFPPHKEHGHFNDGVCGVFIKEKSGLSQSTVSHFLSVLQQAELVIPTRIGKWTYYRRNEAMIREYLKTIIREL